MCITCKLMILAFSYQDGGEDPKNLNTRQNQLKVKEVPTILEFSSYMASGFLAPINEYYHYCQFQKREGEYENVPFAGFVALKKYFLAVIFTGIKIIGFMYFPHSFAITKEYEAWPFYKRILYIFPAGEMIIIQYLAGLLYAEAQAVASGSTYDGKGGFNRVQNVDIQVIQYKFKVWQDLVRHWNMSIHSWLKNYIYIRLLQINTNSKVAQFTVYFCSALWHGIYPLYFIFFTYAFIENAFANYLESTLKGMKSESMKKIISKINWVIMKFTGYYFGVWYLQLDAAKSFAYLQNTGYCLFYVLIAKTMIVSLLSLFNSKEKKMKEN